MVNKTNQLTRPLDIINSINKPIRDFFFFIIYQNYTLFFNKIDLELENQPFLPVSLGRSPWACWSYPWYGLVSCVLRHCGGHASPPENRQIEKSSLSVLITMITFVYDYFFTCIYNYVILLPIIIVCCLIYYAFVMHCNLALGQLGYDFACFLK